MRDKTSTLTHRWMEQVWNNGRESAIDEMLDDNAIVHGIEGINEKGPQGFKTFYRSFREQFPKLHVEVEHVVTEDDYETSRCTVDATNANGQNVHFTGMTYVQIRNGKITEGWNNFDFLAMYQQLGFKMSVVEELTA
jgi:predicted ester cyclase